MTLSRKHYRKIAEIIRVFGVYGTPAIVDKLSQYFAEDNPRFDKERFIDACGYTRKKVVK